MEVCEVLLCLNHDDSFFPNSNPIFMFSFCLKWCYISALFIKWYRIELLFPLRTWPWVTVFLAARLGNSFVFQWIKVYGSETLELSCRTCYEVTINDMCYAQNDLGKWTHLLYFVCGRWSIKFRTFLDVLFPIRKHVSSFKFALIRSMVIWDLVCSNQDEVALEWVGNRQHRKFGFLDLKLSG